MTAAAQIETTFREEHGRVMAALISQLGDFTLAEDALQDALVNALERWQIDGVPHNPGAWLTAVAKRRAIDRIHSAGTVPARNPGRRRGGLSAWRELPGREGNQPERQGERRVR